MTRAFSDLSKEPVKAVETAIAARWESMDILNRTIDAHADDENFVFLKGRRRPTASRAFTMCWREP